MVLTWAELEAASPDIAPRGRELLERFQFVLVGTLTKDGSPRVKPCEAYLIDGHLLLNMMPRSLKALDLLRDPRVYVHTPVTSKDGTEGEFKLAGRAATLEDPGLRKKLDDLFWQMIQWRPAPDSHYFEIVAERVAYHRLRRRRDCASLAACVEPPASDTYPQTSPGGASDLSYEGTPKRPIGHTTRIARE